MKKRDFLSLNDLSSDELWAIVRRGMELKQLCRRGATPQTLQGKVLAMIFHKSSTRTRMSFAVGMAQLGGHAVELPAGETQLDRGESLMDTARVLSEMVDVMMIRTASHRQLETLAEATSIPVINGLSDSYHPCQLLADIQTWVEQRDTVRDGLVAWVGDGNNVCQSWINAARLCDFRLHIACPEGCEPNAALLNSSGERVRVYHVAEAAVRDADVVVTDVWVSMGQQRDIGEWARKFAAFQVNAALMAEAKPDALFMHCLPAHRGEEVSAEVIDGPQSMVWEEAGNRLHVQKALLEFLLTDG